MSKIVKKEVFHGLGGDLAIDSSRGLIKAKGGDTIVTLDDGSRHVLAKELMEAEPEDPPAEEVPPVDPPATGEGSGEGSGEGTQIPPADDLL